VSQEVTLKSRKNSRAARPDALLDALVTDDRAFDEHLVRSALDYVNGTLEVGPNRADPEAALAWAPKVIIERYKRASGIGAMPIKPKPWQPSNPIKTQMAVAFMVNGLARWRHERATGRSAANSGSAFEWVNSMLREVPMLTYWQVGLKGLTAVTVPELDRAERCVAYAVACIAGNRWGMGNRVDYCGFVPASESKPHLFLADNLKQKFCCVAHSNAQRQREFKQAARKHK
jgi:hypothetical protein